MLSVSEAVTLLIKMSRLTRNKTRKKEEKQKKLIDSDSDDFVSPKKSKKSKVETSVEGQFRVADPVPARSPAPSPAEEGTAPAVCPVCGLRARDLSGHTKQCAAKNGLTVQQSIALRRLEDQHREERQRLGAPALPAPARSTRPRQPARRRAEPRPGAGADPDLELALALSISGARTGEELAPSYPIPTSVPDSVPPPPLRLPQAPPARRGRGRGRAPTGPTRLERISGEEQARLLGERVAALLESAPAPALQAAAGRGAGIGRMGVLWGLAGSLDQVTGEQLQVSNFKPWLSVKADPLQAAEPEHAPALDTGPEQCETPCLPDQKPPSELGRAWLSLLQSGTQSDLSVLCSGGEEVAAHSLVLVCRAPALLPRLVIENTGRQFLPATEHSRPAVLTALQFLYGGLVPDTAPPGLAGLAQDWGLPRLVSRPQPRPQPALVTPTQRLDILLDCCDQAGEQELSQQETPTESPAVVLERGEAEEGIEEEFEEDTSEEAVEDREWTAVCNFLTQRRGSRAELSGDEELGKESAEEELGKESAEEELGRESEEEELGRESEKEVLEREDELLGREEEKQGIEEEGFNSEKFEQASATIRSQSYTKLVGGTTTRASTPDMFDLTEEEDEEDLEEDVIDLSRQFRSPILTKEVQKAEETEEALSLKRRLSSSPGCSNKRLRPGRWVGHNSIVLYCMKPLLQPCW